MSIISDIVNKIFAAPGSSSTVKPPMAAPTPVATTSNDKTQNVDVDKVMSDLAKRHSEKLNWQTSIVDLMKVLNLDSSLTARKQLAKELNYSGSSEDSAAMNVWLHEQVIRKLIENGGTVPKDLMH